MTSTHAVPPLPQPQPPAAAAQALTDAAQAAAHAWAQPLDSARHQRAVSQLDSILRDLGIAARALGLGRTKAYELARTGQFPCRVIRIGDTYRIPTPGLLELLGVTAEAPATTARPA